MSDLDHFFAEQDELMNRPEENLNDYLARRQNSIICPKHAFSSEIITADHVSAIIRLENLTADLVSSNSESPNSCPPTDLYDSPKIISRSPAIPDEPTGVTNAVHSPSVDPPHQLHPSATKRKHDDADRKQYPVKKQKSANEPVEPAPYEAASPIHIYAKHNVSADVAPGQSSSRAALATIDSEARSEDGTSGSPKRIMSEPLLPPAAPAELKNHDQGPFCGLKKAASVNFDIEFISAQANRPDAPSPAQHVANSRPPQPVVTTKTSVRSSVFSKGLPPPLKYPATAADCSNITTPPSTAPNVTPAPASKALPRTGRVPTMSAAATRGTSAAQKHKGKKKKELITPLEYAQRLLAQMTERRPSGKKYKQFLEGARVFYYGGDKTYAGEATRKRMDIIIRHGGTLVPKYDPDVVTHIINDGDSYMLLETIGVKKMSDIPKHIIIETWKWVVDGQAGIIRRPSSAQDQELGKSKQRERAVSRSSSNAPTENEDDSDYEPDSEDNHAAFWGIDEGQSSHHGNSKQATSSGAPAAARTNQNQDQKVQFGADRSTDMSESSDVSHISDFTQDKVLPGDGAKISPHAGLLPSPPPTPQSHHGGAPDPAFDPLAEFYEQARAEQIAEMFKGSEDDDEENKNDDGSAPSKDGTKSRFSCDDKGGKQRLGPCPNQDVVDKLTELKALHAVKATPDDIWRVFSLRHSLASLRKYPKRIESFEEARKLPGVGEKTARKIMEIIKTGNLQRLVYEDGEDIQTVKMLYGIHSVGIATAWQWYKNGCRTLEDVAARKGGITLNPAQEIGLKFYKDINTRIPRSEVQELFDIIKVEALKIDPKLFVEVMGSFRRLKADCGDIDVLITRPTDDGRTHRGVIRKLLAVLRQMGNITEDLSVPKNYDDLEIVYHGLCRRDPQSLRRRIDFLTVPWSSRGAALLYYTGDDICTLPFPALLRIAHTAPCVIYLMTRVGWTSVWNLAWHTVQSLAPLESTYDGLFAQSARALRGSGPRSER